MQCSGRCLAFVRSLSLAAATAGASCQEKRPEQTVVEHPSLPSATRLLLSLSSVSRFYVLSECKRTIACDVDRPGIRMLGRRSEPEQAGHICYILFLRFGFGPTSPDEVNCFRRFRTRLRGSVSSRSWSPGDTLLRPKPFRERVYTSDRASRGPQDDDSGENMFFGHTVYRFLARQIRQQFLPLCRCVCV